MSNLTGVLADSLKGSLVGSLTGRLTHIFANYPFTSDLVDTSTYGNTATLTRASSKTVIPDSTSEDTYDIGINTAGFPGTGVHVNPDHTNSCLQSNTFSAWTKRAATITTDAKLDPKGNTGGYKLTATGSPADGIAYIYNAAVSHVAGQNGTMEIFIAQGNTDWCLLQIGDAVNVAQIWFNVSTGAFGTEAGAYTIDTKSCRQTKNGWWHVCLNLTFTTGGAGNAIVYVTRSDGAYDAQAGDYIYMHQCDIIKNTTAVNLSPTTTTTIAATTGGDIITAPSTHFVANNFTVSMKYKAEGYDTNSYLYDRTVDANNYMKLHMVKGSGVFRLEKEGGGNYATVDVAYTETIDQVYTIVMTQSSTAGLTLSVNAVSATDATGTHDMTIPTVVYIGGDSSSTLQAVGQIYDVEVDTL